MQHIMEPYKLKAKQSLLFTRIEAIATFHRSAKGVQEQGWTVRGDRSPFTEGHEDLTITTKRPDHWDKRESSGSSEEKWVIFRQFTSLKELPDKLQSLIETHRLRSPINISMAIRTPPSDPAPQLESLQLERHSLFSTLPLPVSTTLPVHLSASFILTPDRRNVRFDDSSDDNLESRYNRWLLADVAPLLYFELLEIMLRRYNQNWPFWPGNTPSNDEDAISRVRSTELPVSLSLITFPRFWWLPFIVITWQDAVDTYVQVLFRTHPRNSSLPTKLSSWGSNQSK